MQRWLVDVTAQFQQTHHVDRAIDCIQAAGIDGKLLQQKVGQIGRAVMGNFETYRKAELAAVQLALQRVPQILDIVVVHPQIAVARDAKLRVGGDLAASKQIGNMRPDDRRQQTECGITR